jgi:hypothetical protein
MTCWPKPLGCRTPQSSLHKAQTRVWTPEHLVPLRDRVRTNNKAQLEALNDALDRRFHQPDAEWMGVFRVAGEMAVMELVGRQELPPSDRQLLRQLWEALLVA